MILVDTNVLARTLQVEHIHHQAATNAIAYQREKMGEVCVITPQILVEFYAIGTRRQNGLGLTAEQTLGWIENFKQRFPLLDETPALFAQWEFLVAKYKPANRQVFDTRHVASMLVNNVFSILTFNDKDFLPFTEIKTFNPFDVLNFPRV